MSKFYIRTVIYEENSTGKLAQTSLMVELPIKSEFQRNFILNGIKRVLPSRIIDILQKKIDLDLLATLEAKHS